MLPFLSFGALLRDATLHPLVVLPLRRPRENTQGLRLFLAVHGGVRCLHQPRPSSPQTPWKPSSPSPTTWHGRRQRPGLPRRRRPAPRRYPEQTLSAAAGIAPWSRPTCRATTAYPPVSPLSTAFGTIRGCGGRHAGSVRDLLTSPGTAACVPRPRRARPARQGRSHLCGCRPTSQIALGRYRLQY